MPSSTPEPHQDLDQTPDQYRTQVQTRVQNLLCGHRPRDPHLSTVSTRRLILEGLVEEVKIYRLHKEEKAREEKERERRRMSSQNGHGRREEREQHRDMTHGDGGRRRRRRHASRDRSPSCDSEREHCRSGGQRGHHHHHHHHRRSRDGSRHTSRERSRSRSHRHDRRQHHHDPVIEGPPDSNPRYKISGGAEPPGTLSPPSNHHQSRHSPSRSRKRRPSPRRGPDGTTPFGRLPRKAVGVGIAAHLVNTYRHIKAEHEVGERSRGGLEKKVDGWRGRKKESADDGSKRESAREGEKLEKDDGRRRRIEDRERHGDRDRGRRNGNDRRKPYTSRDTYKDVSKKLPLPSAASPAPQDSRTLSLPAVRLQDATSPSSGSHAWTPTPDTFVPPAPPPRSRSITPPYPPSCSRSRSTTPPYPSTSGVSPLPPPPPPPKSPSSSLPSPASSPPHAALLNEIQSGAGFKLRKVPSLDKRDKSSAASVGRVYEATPHSREVEEREREEEQGGWSSDEEGEGDGGERARERRRVLVEDLNRRFGGS